MKMTFRWFGPHNDRIPLHFIRQIPGVEGVVWALHDVAVGEEWPLEKILEVKRSTQAYELHMDVVESVNVHEDIKLGRSTRDKYIKNYQRTIEKLAKVGVKVICYNFMPVFYWTRTELYKEAEDGSTALFFDKKLVDSMDPQEMLTKILGDPKLTMPGWEPERLQKLSEIFEAYKNITEEDLWENLSYFLKRIIPVAEANHIKMAIHPDDPPWSIFGLPRIIKDRQDINRLLGIIDSPYHCVTMCSGSLGASLNNDVPTIIRDFCDRIPFAHIRNVKVYENGDFMETSHKTTDGSVDIYGVVKALHDNGFKGYARPDHGRHIWNEECRPGYGLYDRALGVMYLLGIWETLSRCTQEASHATDS